MIFTKDQVEKIINIIDYHFSFTISTNFGIDGLDKGDIDLLRDFGVKIDDFKGKLSEYDKMYLFGKLSSILRNEQVKSLEYKDFEKYIWSGQYVPLTKNEQFQLELSKRRSYVHLKGLKERAKASVNQIILDQEQKAKSYYEKVVSEGISRGIVERKSVGAIVSDLGHKLDDWKHDWGRIVETEMNTIFQEGRAEAMKQFDADPEVYKVPFPDACRHCIRLWLTNGIGSKPIVYKLSTLEANGTNIGRKVADWLPVVGSIHPFSITEKKTPILTDNGWKQIQNIEVGDLVLTHKGRFKKVTATLKHFPCPYKEQSHKYTYTIYYKHLNGKDPDDITTLTFTGDHKILTNRGWIMVKDLTQQDKLVKVMKSCVICGKPMESYSNDYRSACSKQCSNKYRSQNVFKQWGDRSEEELKDFKSKISKKVTENWENGIHENTLLNLKSEENRKRVSDRMLNGGAIKALEAQGGKTTSNIQLKLYEMVLTLFPEAELEFKFLNKRLDIALPNYKIDIEFDGSNWHKGRVESDALRDKLLKDNGWHILRYVDKLPKLGQLRLDIETIIHNDDHKYTFEETDILFIKRNYSGKDVKLYDITVEEDESFIARGVVVHNCRETLTRKPKGYVWDEETKNFEVPKTSTKDYERGKSKVKVIVGDKVFEN